MKTTFGFILCILWSARCKARELAGRAVCTAFLGPGTGEKC